MLVNASVFKRRILITLELVNGIIHQFTVKHPKAYKQAEVFESQACNLTEELWLQLLYDILQTVFTIVCQIHKHRNARGKFYQFLLNFPSLAFVFFLFFREFFLLLRRDVISLLLFGLLNVL